MKTRSIFLLFFLLSQILFGQNATIKEETVSLNTYDFGTPNPVPILKDNSKIYPYFKFEEYQHQSKKKEWKVVTLENDYIKVMVLPQIGGKVWGAIEKSTGKEFLYKNEVVKFRNIAMRGPWTSGGIEFNFGIIGHHPSTATAVDYVVKENSDGSVSCVVGNTDLPSNTQWRVEIRLEKDKAFFETNASWYNASPVNQSYYNWMTGAAVATQDLEFFIPGNRSLAHSGNSEEWPIDKESRELSYYRNNDFGPDKSYHIVGKYNNFFGGYYHDNNFGFGQWAPYEEMPGQKLWLWSQARSGGIWEDLLTDTDGQYIEFQAGRLFNQYFPEAKNPISQANFEPFVMDRWREIWFPYKEIGGMEAVSEYGVLNVEKKEKGIYIGLNALQTIDDELKVYNDGIEIFSKEISLNPMEIFSKELTLDSHGEVEVNLGNRKLYYTSDKKKIEIKRPFVDDENIKLSETQILYNEGWEALKYREFDKALEKLIALVKLDPSHQDALVKLAELEYRRTNYDKALKHLNSVLKMDTYNYGANYFAGLAYREKKDYVNALESFGWAARSMQYRSVAYAQMAEIYMLSQDLENANSYAQKALNFNNYNLNAKEVQLLLRRKKGNKNEFNNVVEDILKIDALNHFVKSEQSFFNENHQVKLDAKNEFSEETVLAIALKYVSLGYSNDALSLLKTVNHWPKAKLWLAYLSKDINSEKSNEYLKELINADSNFVFPFRRETVAALEWANAKNEHWKLKYFLAQNYIAVGKIEEGEQLLRDCNNEPDSDVFYRFRAKMLSDDAFKTREKDYEKATSLNKTDWKLHDEFIQFYLGNSKFEEARKLSSNSYKKFPKNSNIGLGYAKALLKVGEYDKSISILKKLNILPFEHASESKDIYTKSHVLLAYKKMESKKYKTAIQLLENSKKWPENLGVGAPYEPDNRMQDYLLSQCYKKLGDTNKSDERLNKVVEYNTDPKELKGRQHLFRLLALKKTLKSKEQQSFVEALSKKKNNFWAQMALAFFNNDVVALEKIKNSGKLLVDEIKIFEAAIKL